VIKGILRAASIVFPRAQDVSEVLISAPWEKMGSPHWFFAQVGKMARIMQEITPKRGPAMYGFEREMKPANTIFSLEDGQKAAMDAKFVFETCVKFLQQWKP
jgi:hypothetical protein